MKLGASTQKYLELLKINFRIGTFPNLGIGITYLCFIPFIQGTSNLNAIYAAECLEKWVAPIGIILLVPICQPEQNKELQEVISSKSFSYIKIILLRLYLALLSIIICISVFSGYMLIFNCKFSIVPYIMGTFASALALGSFGFFISVICNNTIIGYLASVGYFLCNWLGMITSSNILYLFSMTDGNFIDKYYLIVLGLFCLGSALVYKKRVLT